MNKLHIVTEGKFDAELLRILIGEASEKTSGPTLEFWEGQGWSETESIACSLLATRHEPVVLVNDSDALDKERIQDRRANARELLGLYAPRSLFRVVLFIPEVEALLFRDKALLKALFGGKVSKDDLVRAESRPKAILQKLCKQEKLKPIELLPKLAKMDLSKLREAEEIQEIATFGGFKLETRSQPARRRQVG